MALDTLLVRRHNICQVGLVQERVFSPSPFPLTFTEIFASWHNSPHAGWMKYKPAGKITITKFSLVFLPAEFMLQISEDCIPYISLLVTLVTPTKSWLSHAFSQWHSSILLIYKLGKKILVPKWRRVEQLLSVIIMTRFLRPTVSWWYVGTLNPNHIV